MNIFFDNILLGLSVAASPEGLMNPLWPGGVTAQNSALPSRKVIRLFSVPRFIAVPMARTSSSPAFGIPS